MAGTVAVIAWILEAAFYAALEYYAAILAGAYYLKANNDSKRAASRARRNLASLAEGGRALMVRQPLTARRTLYGVNRMSGPITLMHVSASKYLYILITISAHPVQAIDDVYLNDEVLDVDSNGTVLSKYYGSVVVKKGLGTTAGDADLNAYLIAENLTAKDGAPLWTANHLQAGCGKILVRLTPNRNIFPSGIPNISAIVSGKLVYDPRTATTYYSPNSALCIRDYMVDPDLLGATASEIDDAGMVVQANICDELVAGKGQANTFGRVQILPSPIGPVQDTTYNAAGSLSGTEGYKYRVTFYDASGETPGSPAPSGFWYPPSSVFLRGIRMTSVPIGAAGTVGRKIYRSDRSGDFPRLAGTISDNTTTAFIDSGSLAGAYIPTLNTTDIKDTLVRDKTLPFLVNGDSVQLTTTGTLPAPYALLTTYFYIYINSTTGKVATTKANALAGIGIVRTTVGSGVHSISRTAEARYSLHGPIDAIDTPKGALEAMLTSCAGDLTNPGGIWSLLVGSWRAPTITLSENDLDGPIKVVARISKRELANGVKGTFIDPANNWQPTDFPPTTNALYKSEDNNERIWQDVELPFTLSPSMAQRLSKISLERVRQQITTVWPCKLSAFRVQVGDVVGLTNARFGWVAKPFEVTDLKFAVRSDNDSPHLGVDITFRETAAGVYDWNSGEETLIDLAPNTNLPDPSIVDEPLNFVAASGTDHLYLRNDGTVFTRARLTWTASTDANVTSAGFFEVEYRKQESLLVDWEKDTAVPGTESSTYILDVEDGVAYLFRVRAVNNLGVRSTWAVVRHVIVGKTALPANVTGFSAAQNGNVVVLRWDQVADLDLSGYEIRYIVMGGTNWDAATPLTRVTRGTQITTAGLPPGSWTLLNKARDTSENYSATAATYNIVMANAFDVIEKVVDEPDFLGAKTNFVHHWTGLLVPDSQDAASLDTWDTFDIFVPNPFATCSYVTNKDIDLLFASTVRVWADMAATLGPGVTLGFPNPKLEIDYHSGAGFDGYEPWTIGTVIARYVRAKLVLLTADGVAYVSRFQTNADVESRTETGVGVVVAAGGTAIVFAARYHFTPSIQITAQGAALFPGHTGATGTGFTAHVYNTAGTSVGGTISWTSDGE